MGARGKVPVPTTQAEAASTALIIWRRIIPIMRERGATILSPASNEEILLHLRQMALRLDKAARTKRRTCEFTIQMDRDAVQRFVAICESISVAGWLDKLPMYDAMKAVISRKPGRPRYSSSERMLRLDPEFTIHERNRWRIKRAEAVDAQQTSCMDEVISRGKTILTL